MILEAAIIKLTRNLDLVLRNEQDSISSHQDLKEKALDCLKTLVEQAPDVEFLGLIKDPSHEILIGYLLNILCQLIKNDKSKKIRLSSIECIKSIIHRHKSLHHDKDPYTPCSVNIFRSALPGVTSSLFKLLMNDTKLPKNLMVEGSGILTEYIATAFLPCNHRQHPDTYPEPTLQCDTNPKIQILFLLDGQNLADICDNLSVRISYLIDYAINHSSELAIEIEGAILNLCHRITNETCIELLKRSLPSIIRFTAFMSSLLEKQDRVIGVQEYKLKAILLVDAIKSHADGDTKDGDMLNCVIISSLIKVLDNLEESHKTMLSSEREAELSILNGYLKITTPSTITSLLETIDRRIQLLDLLQNLCEFSTGQPFLFLTDVKVGDSALEQTLGNRIYTVDKRFSNLSASEISLVSSICTMVGLNVNWLCFYDIFSNNLRQFESPQNLYVTHLTLLGCLKREPNDNRLVDFARQNLLYYVDQIQENYSFLRSGEIEDVHQILKIVIAIETTLTIVKIIYRFSKDHEEKILTLRTILCPLLNWSSSSNRAISEASLSCLSGISRLYAYSSIKTLIETNTDYIVDGVAQMIDSFAYNPEITSVLAITFKLSSIETFYYFRDIYEKIFRLASVHYNTTRSESIALLFHRTLSILSDWNSNELDRLETRVPLQDEASTRSVIDEISIDRRLKKLEDDSAKLETISEPKESYEITEEQVANEIRSGKILDDPKQHQETEHPAPPKKKLTHIELTERILTHCIHFVSSSREQTKILALKSAALALRLLAEDENTLLPLVHQLWSPLVSRLTSDYRLNLEVSLCSFECLMSMSITAKDFIKRRTLDTIIPRLCLFLEAQATRSQGKREFEPYCMTVAYKCQLVILSNLGQLAYNIQLGYQNLWRVIKVALIYLDSKQVPELRHAAKVSLHYMIALDPDCVWYFSKNSGHLTELPLDKIYESFQASSYCQIDPK